MMATDEQIREARERAFENRWVLMANQPSATWLVFGDTRDLDEGRNVLGEGATPDEALVDALLS